MDHELNALYAELKEKRKLVETYETAQAYPALKADFLALQEKYAKLLQQPPKVVEKVVEKPVQLPAPKRPVGRPRKEDDDASLLREQLTQLKESIAPSDLYVPAGFTPNEDIMVRMLMTRYSVTADAFYTMLYQLGGKHVDKLPDPKIIDVHLTHIRKKLKKFDIRIIKVRIAEWRVSKEDKAKFKALIPPE